MGADRQASLQVPSVKPRLSAASCRAWLSLSLGKRVLTGTGAVTILSKGVRQRRCLCVLCVFFQLAQLHALALSTKPTFSTFYERRAGRLYLIWTALVSRLHQLSPNRLSWRELSIGVTVAGFLWVLHLLRLRIVTGRIQVSLSHQIDARDRMGRELHDSLLQSFQGIALQVQGIAKRISSSDPLRCEIEEVLDRADEALSEARRRACRFATRTTSFELPDRIARCGGELSKEHPASFVVAIVGRQRELESTVHEEAYAIAGEALRNAFLHAAASRIEVEITYASALLSVRVRDDGIGIARKETQESQMSELRFVGMRERARAVCGELQVWSSAAAGTEIELLVPAAMAYSPCCDKTS